MNHESLITIRPSRAHRLAPADIGHFGCLRFPRGISRLLCIGILLAPFFAPDLHAQTFIWSIVTTSQNDLFIRLSQDGQDTFDFCIGTAGTVQHVFCAQGDLIAPENAGEPVNQTDAVIQGVFYAPKLELASVCPSGPQWGMNQAGSFANTYNPIIAVAYTRSAQTLDVWSVLKFQWQPSLQPYFSGGISLLTRYTMLPNGVLGIRQVFIAPEYLVYGNNLNPQNFEYNFWVPLASSLFWSIGSNLDESGLPTRFMVGSNETSVMYERVSTSGGYLVAQNMPFALVTGNKPPADYTGAAWVGYSNQVSNYPGAHVMIPTLQMSSLATGSIVDINYQIVLRKSVTREFLNTLALAVQNAPAPAIYPASYSFSGELSNIVAYLRTIGAYPGVQTNHLAPYLQVQ